VKFHCAILILSGVMAGLVPAISSKQAVPTRSGCPARDRA
jgi:hypothetical protein